MPKIQLDRREKSPETDTEEVPTKRERSLSFRKGSVATSKTEFNGTERANMLTKLVTARKNPSAIFKPPFGTNMEEHHSMLGEHAKNLWEYNKITDVTVKLRGTSYPCHKTVLSCYSKYFKKLLLETKTSGKEINLKLSSVTNVAFEVLLKYMYTSELNVTCQNIGEVYTGARKLGLDGALVLCKRILTGKSKYNVHSVYLYVTAKKQRLEDVAADALQVMTRRFEEIVGTPEFLDLDFPQVLEYLSQDALAVRSEVVVYLAALKWLSVKYLEREEYATDVIRCVRFQMMTLNEILACFSPPLLPGILELKSINDYMLAATCYVAARTVNEEKRFGRYACKPRRYLRPREYYIPWDPSIFDPDRHAMYAQWMAATTIQAAFRGHKARKSIKADKEAGLLQKTDFEIDPFEENLARLDVFEPPKDEVRYSFMDNILKSVEGFLRGTDAGEDAHNHSEVTELKNKYEPSKEEQEDPLEEAQYSLEEESVETPQLRYKITVRRSSTMAKPEQIRGLADGIEPAKCAPYNSEVTKLQKKYEQSNEVQEIPLEEAQDSLEEESLEMMQLRQQKTVSRSSSLDTIVAQINRLAEDIELKKYVSDTVVDINSEVIQKKALEKPVSFDKLHSRASEVARKIESQSNENGKNCIIVTGGFISDTEEDNLEGKQMFVFNCEKRKWKRYGTMEKARHHHCVIFLNGQLYFIGGCNPEKTKKNTMVAERTCYKLEMSSMTWSRIAKMRHCRTYHGVAELNGKIYAVGGKDDNGRLLSSVEVYDPNLDAWTELNSPLDIPTLGMGVCSHQGRLWVVGGMVLDSSGNMKTIKEVKCYDPKKRRWSQNMKSLPLPRAFVTAVSFEDQLFVIGGMSQSEALKEKKSMRSVSDVFCYNSKENRWEPATFLPYPMHYVKTAVIGNSLYVLGGLTTYRKTAVDDVLEYDKNTRKWRSVSDLPQPLSGFAAITVPAFTAF